MSQVSTEIYHKGIETVCTAYNNLNKDSPVIPTQYLREKLRLILKENSFQFSKKNYLQSHVTAMGTKMAINFANIPMANIETDSMQKPSLNHYSFFFTVGNVTLRT